MTDEVNIDEVMTRRFELADQMDQIVARQKAELAPLSEELALCEAFIKAELLKTGAQQWKSSSTGHMTFWTTKDSVTVEDMGQVIHRILAESPPPDTLIGGSNAGGVWEAILTHIQETGLWGLLNKAVNKTAVKEMIEAQQQPPGVKYVSFRDLAWRKGKL
jgi:hypothetical protein